MRVSAKGEYAIRAMLDLAMHRGDGLVPIEEVAARQGIPQRYLEQVLLQLKRAGLLVSKRGSSGGYGLRRAPAEIPVGSVLRAVEGTLAGPETPRGRTTPDDLTDLWHEVAEAVSGVLDHTTLDDLRRRAEARRSASSPMYHI